MGKVCRRCGRELTDPKSEARGIGPICAQHEKREATLTFSRDDSPIMEFPEAPPPVSIRQLDAFFDYPHPRAEREIKAELNKIQENELPLKRGVFSEV